MPLAAFVQAGCSTVRSSPVHDYEASRKSVGLNYFLPTRMMRMTATRTPLRLDELARAKSAKETEATRLRGELNTAKQVRVAAERVLVAGASNRQALQEAVYEAQAKEAVARAALTASEADLANINSSLEALQRQGQTCTRAIKSHALGKQHGGE